MVSTDNAELYLVVVLDAYYDFNSLEYYFARLLEEEVKYLEQKISRMRRPGVDIDILKVREQEILTFDQVKKNLGITKP